MALWAFRLRRRPQHPNAQCPPFPRNWNPAPDLFEATGRAVWDGKRTLQGVWVAHPLAASARRVRIFNETNGTAVDGALFKRDAALNGASVLISSEAAELLGMTVGETTELRIVAVTPVQADESQTAAAPEKPAEAETEPAGMKIQNPRHPKLRPRIQNLRTHLPKPPNNLQKRQPLPWQIPNPRPSPEIEAEPEEKAPVAKPEPVEPPKPAAPEKPEAQTQEPTTTEAEQETPEDKARVFKFEKAPAARACRKACRDQA